MAQDTAAMHNKKETQHHQPRKLRTPPSVGSTLALEEGDRTPGGVAVREVVMGGKALTVHCMPSAAAASMAEVGAVSFSNASKLTAPPVKSRTRNRYGRGTPASAI